MNNHLQGILSKGYVLFPKALFEEQMILNQQAKGHFEAFVLVRHMLTTVKPPVASMGIRSNADGANLSSH